MEYVLLGGRQPVDPAPLGEHGPVLEADDREGGLPGQIFIELPAGSVRHCPTAARKALRRFSASASLYLP